MIYIAENLKSLRKSMDLTQEEIAEMLGVSPQSVSKWERGDTYPDMTLLPALANLFKTSIDALIGMDKIHDTAARTAVFQTEHEYLRSGDYLAAAAVLEEALKTFPNNESYMSELALAYAFDNTPDKLAQALNLCQRVLSGNPTEKVRHTTRAALCFLFLKTGDRDKAVAAAKNLPHMRESREAILDQIEKEITPAEIDEYLRFIALGEEPEQDILCVDFGFGMISVAKDYDLLKKINALRTAFGHRGLPNIRLRDNGSLAPNQVRLRYYADYLLDKEFTDAGHAVDDITSILREIIEKRLERAD